MENLFTEDPKKISLMSIAGIIFGLPLFLIVGMLGFIFILPPTIIFILSLVDMINRKEKN